MHKIDFEEVKQPYTLEEVITEAKRCLNCKVPSCVEGCPINNRIPEFIHEVSKGNIGVAKEILDSRTTLPCICGRVCPHDKQCEGHCILNKKNAPIHIGKIESFIGDFNHEYKLEKYRKLIKPTNKVAVVGSGPAGMACAYVLITNGVAVTVYDKNELNGGVLRYGIPAYRLPNELVQREIDKLEALGVEFRNNIEVGTDVMLADLENEYDAVFLGVGASKSKNIPIDGVGLDGVYHATEFLKQIGEYTEGKLNKNDLIIKENDTVIVIGGGNVAIDGSRASKRIADDSKIVYRRTQDVMPANNAEYEEAVEDGVEFMWKRTPIEFVGVDGVLTGFRVSNGWDNPDGVEEIIPCTKALIAIGSDLDTSVGNGIDMKIGENWFIDVENHKLVGSEKIFAGGDCVVGAMTVVVAVREGVATGNRILEYIGK